NDADVADAPVNVVTFNQSLTEGTPFSDVVATFVDDNLGAIPNDFQAEIAWGDGVNTLGMIAQIAPGVFTVSGTHTFEEATYNRSVEVTDKGGSFDSDAGTYTVADAPLNPTGSIPFSGFEGIPLVNQLVGSFSDTNPLGTVASDFSAQIDWGDNTSVFGATIEKLGLGNQYDVYGTHTYAEEGTYTVRTTVKDIGGSTIIRTNTVTIRDAPISDIETGPLVATEGVPVPIGTDVARFQDANFNAPVADFTAAEGGSVLVDYGDGNGLVPARVIPLGGGSFDIFNIDPIMYKEEGT